MIVKEGDKWCVKSKDGARGFGCYDSEDAAKDRLRQVEAFKHMDDKIETRFDRGTIGKISKTAQGFLRIDGALTRIGIFTYRKADGGERREYRPADEVFNSDSLATIPGAPVTDLHPPDLVTPANVRELQRGFVAEGVKRDGRFVTAPIVIQDAAMIAAVESGERRELSCGYTCRLDWTPGEFEGERYDAIQRGIVANHVALGPRGWGRAGPEVALRMDSAALHDFVKQRLELMGKSVEDMALDLGQDAWALHSFLGGWWDAMKPASATRVGKVARSELDAIAKFVEQDISTLFALVPVSERLDGHNEPRKRTMENVKIRIDGIEYDVAASAAPHIGKAIETRDADKTAAIARADAAQAKVDALTTERDGIKARLDAAESPDRLASAVAARVGLETKARGILGDDADLKGKSDKDIKLACISRSDSKFDPAGKSDPYVDARFDVLNTETETQRRKDDAARALIGNRQDGATAPDVDKSRAAMLEANRKRATEPLTATK
jgi:hypothetical protein